jgi:hypothetical protein
MAISLTEDELASLRGMVTPIRTDGGVILTDGGSFIRYGAEKMNEQLAQAPQGARSAQTLEALRAHLKGVSAQ